MANVTKSNDSANLAEMVALILDKGIVIDAWVKLSMVGIELLLIEARVVIASIETYLKYAEAIRLTAGTFKYGEAIGPTAGTWKPANQIELVPHGA
jgi:hypothetical protein